MFQYNPSLEVVTPVGDNERSDPSMVLVPSVSKYTSDITFYTSAINEDGAIKEARNYITIVTRDSEKDALRLDGQLISEYS